MREFETGITRILMKKKLGRIFYYAIYYIHFQQFFKLFMFKTHAKKSQIIIVEKLNIAIILILCELLLRNSSACIFLFIKRAAKQINSFYNNKTQQCIEKKDAIIIQSKLCQLGL